MKKIAKILISSATIAVLLITNVCAQSKKLGIGLNFGLPSTEGHYDIVFGVDLRLQFNVTQQLSIPFTVGYTNYFSENLDYVPFPDSNVSINHNYAFIPVKAGLKYFIDESGTGFYGLAEAGVAFGLNKNSQIGFLYSPSIGYSFNNGLDFSLKYEGVSNGQKEVGVIQGFDNTKSNGQVALRIAYGFKL